MSLRSPTRLRTFYEVVAPVYAHLTAPLSTHARQAGLRWLNVADGEQVLEIGPGPGRAFRILLTQNPTGWTDALEPAAAMRRRIRRRAARVGHARFSVQSGTATHLPYPTEHFDAVFSAYVYDLLPASHLPSAVDELRRVLRPGGRAVLIAMAVPASRPGRWWARLARLCPPLLGGSRPVSIRTVLRRAGLRISRSETVSQMGFPSRVTEIYRPRASSN